MTRIQEHRNLYKLVRKANHHFKLYKQAMNSIQQVIDRDHSILTDSIRFSDLSNDYDIYNYNEEDENSLKHHLQGEDTFPIHWATSLANLELVKLFSKDISHFEYHYCANEERPKRPIHIAIDYFYQGLNTELMEFLIKEYPEDIRSYYKGGLPLYRVNMEDTNQKEIDIIEMMIDEYPEAMFVEDHEMYPIERASYIRNEEVIRLFLQKSYYQKLFDWRINPDREFDYDEDGNIIDVTEDDDDKKSLKPLWEKNRYATWHRLINDFIFPNEVPADEELPVYDIPSVVESLFERAGNFPVLVDAVGKISVDDFALLIENIDFDREVTDMKGRTALVETIHQAYLNPTHWDDYFRPIFDMIMDNLYSEDAYEMTVHEEKEFGFYLFKAFIYRKMYDTSELIHSIIDKDTDKYLLHLAADYGLPWDGVKQILKKNMKVLMIQDKDSGLFPFMLAAERSKFSVKRGLLPFISKERATTCLTVVYELFRAKPDVLASLDLNAVVSSTTSSLRFKRRVEHGDTEHDIKHRMKIE